MTCKLQSNSNFYKNIRKVGIFKDIQVIPKISWQCCNAAIKHCQLIGKYIRPRTKEIHQVKSLPPHQKSKTVELTNKLRANSMGCPQVQFKRYVIWFSHLRLGYKRNGWSCLSLWIWCMSLDHQPLSPPSFFLKGNTDLLGSDHNKYVHWFTVFHFKLMCGHPLFWSFGAKHRKGRGPAACRVQLMTLSSITARLFKW